MSLLVSKVPRSLEMKTKVALGFELGDVLLIFLYLAISNLIFGQTSLKFPVVWLGTLAIAFVLYFVKRGKPDQYLQHSVQHFIAPGVLSAGEPDGEPPHYFTFDENEVQS